MTQPTPLKDFEARQKHAPPGRPAPRWCDLEALVPYHMLIGAGGLACAVVGVFAFSWRLGLLAAGVALMCVAWLMAKSAD